MNREQVIITPLSITSAGQIIHFQVKLPKNAKRIIGVELGGRWNMPARVAPLKYGAARTERGGFFKRNTLIGEVKLQSCEEANIFYSGHLQTDENLGLGDFSQNENWKSFEFSHQMNSFEEQVVVDAETTMIQGLYLDRLGLSSKGDVKYLVNVYVWIEIRES